MRHLQEISSSQHLQAMASLSIHLCTHRTRCSEGLEELRTAPVETQTSYSVTPVQVGRRGDYRPVTQDKVPQRKVSS